MDQLHFLSHWLWQQTRSPLKLIPAALNFPDNNMKSKQCQSEHNMKERVAANF
jgi:hypothetical protein